MFIQDNFIEVDVYKSEMQTFDFVLMFVCKGTYTTDVLNVDIRNKL